MTTSEPIAAIDRRRFRRVRWFFFKVFLRVLWHDVFLALPLLRTFRSPPLPRWQAIARRYRGLAVEMGGVLIKLGQYLSARVDILPAEVAEELQGLQDEVPPAPFEAIQAQIEQDFGRPLGEIFAAVDPLPLGAASLAQVHAAELHGGERVVVKALRPGIDVLVETDLAAIGLAIGWVKMWSFVRRRVDLDWLVDEFTTTTRNELDLIAEGHNAERFAADFADDPGVYIPRIYWQTTARHTLTQENVAYLKVADLEALEAAGVDRRELAKKLYRVYMQQIFVHHFVHADPHPGNLFVRPLAAADEAELNLVPGQPVPPGTERPFQVIFVDFGMVAIIPPRLRAALRQLIIGFGHRDAAQVIRAYAAAGILLPGADLAQLEEALDAVFERFWGLEIGRLGDKVRDEAAGLWKEFSRLLLETPIQVQADLVFSNRAIELLAGLATRLDPEFNLWNETLPFARRLAAEAAREGWPERLRELGAGLHNLAELPGNVSDLVAQAQRGRLVVRTAPAPAARRQHERLESALYRIAGAISLAGWLIAGALFYPHEKWLGLACLGVAVAGGLWARLRRFLG